MVNYEISLAVMKGPLRRQPTSKNAKVFVNPPLRGACIPPILNPSTKLNIFILHYICQIIWSPGTSAIDDYIYYITLKNDQIK